MVYKVLKGHWGSGRLVEHGRYRTLGRAGEEAMRLERRLWLKGQDEDKYIGITGPNDKAWLVHRERDLTVPLTAGVRWIITVEECKKEEEVVA